MGMEPRASESAGASGEPAPATPAAEERTGRMQKTRLQRIGRFRVKVRLGEGGMGTVFLCEDPSLGRLVAVKVLRDDMRNDPESRERFLREARAVARVSHPRVVQIYEVEAGDAPFFAMEYVQGASVEELLRRRGRFTVDEACAIIAQAADGLGALHRAGIVHRDITPANILLDGDGGARIVDFGLAAERGQAGEAGVIAGTLHYMAPEQVEGGAIDHRADIYGLGATLYRMLAGEAPFGSSTKDRVLADKLAGDPAEIRARCPAIPSRLAGLVTRMLDRAPERRPQQCEEVAAALRAFRTRRRRGRRALAAAAGLAVLAALAVFARAPASADRGALAEFFANERTLAVDFRRPELRGLALNEFLKPARPAGAVPELGAEGLVFDGGQFDVLFPPVALARARVAGVRWSRLRGDLRVGFGHPEFLARGFSVSLRGGTGDVVFRAVHAGALVAEEAFTVEKLAAAFAHGIDVELGFPDPAAHPGRVQVMLFETQGGKPLLDRRIEKYLPPVEGGWARGCLHIGVSPAPMKRPQCVVRSVTIEGAFDRTRLGRWVAGKDLWRTW